ncbi:MAG TPA: SIS domain-containing protein [Bacteroidales bacterium]|nr:SIS domain-containing protein [Bacteroidales bacterium]
MNKFLKEIFEQPRALEETLNHYLHGEGQGELEKVKQIWRKGRFKSVLFTGMGSSYFAPYTASCILSNNGISSCNINAGELLHYHLPVLKKEVLLTCISQSGESYEVVKVLEKVTSEITCIGITNEETSSLASKATVTLLSKAGREDMTSTKTYISTLLVLHIYSNVLSGKWNPCSMPELQSVIETVSIIINTRDEWLSSAMDFLGHPPFVQIIGRGPSYSSVLQGALMFMEAARNPAAGIFGGEFRHGPMEMSKKGFRAVILAPLGPTYDQGMKMAEDITRFGGKVVLITNSSASVTNTNIFPILIPCQDEYLFPVAAIIPLQFIVNQWATDEGHEPGNFIMGAKVTTTE